MSNIYVHRGHKCGPRFSFRKLQTHNLKTILEDVENREHSEDVGMFNKIQELVKLGQFYSGDVYRLPRPLTWTSRKVRFWKGPSCTTNKILHRKYLWVNHIGKLNKSIVQLPSFGK